MEDVRHGDVADDGAVEHDRYLFAGLGDPRWAVTIRGRIGIKIRR
jgi:hypothetical protein